MAELPEGLVGIISLTDQEVLTGNRVTAFTYERLDKEENLIGELQGVSGGSVDWTQSASVKGAGSISIVDQDQGIDWLSERIRITAHIEGLEPFYVGIWIPSVPTESWSDLGRTWDVQLMDKCTIPDQDAIEATYSVPADTYVVGAVIDLLDSAGESTAAIDIDNSETLSSPMTWVAGTTKLQIINDILDAANYFSLWADMNGSFRVSKYEAPADRAILWELIDGDTSIYSPEFSREQDIFSVPNKMVCTTTGDDTTEGLYSVYTNEDPTSPFSYQARGRWVSKVEETEATDQITLDAYTQRRLIESTSATATVDITHALVPNWTVNSAVRLANAPAGIDHRHVITKTTVPLDPTQLATSTLEEVVDL